MDTAGNLSVWCVRATARLVFASFTIVIAGTIDNGVGFCDVSSLFFKIAPTTL